MRNILTNWREILSCIKKVKSFRGVSLTAVVENKLVTQSKTASKRRLDSA